MFAGAVYDPLHVLFGPGLRLTVTVCPFGFVTVATTLATATLSVTVAVMVTRPPSRVRLLGESDPLCTTGRMWSITPATVTLPALALAVLPEVSVARTAKLQTCAALNT